ncbi:MAG: hypothetical protein ACLRWQ_16810 [Flavonifractor plautii]
MLSPEFKGRGTRCICCPASLLGGASQKDCLGRLPPACARPGKVKRRLGGGADGMAEAVMKMSFGNSIGFQADGMPTLAWYAARAPAPSWRS